MECVWKPKVLTKQMFEKMTDEGNYVIVNSVDKEPYAIVSKSWLSRRIGSAEVMTKVGVSIEAIKQKLFCNHCNGYFGINIDYKCYKCLNPLF